MVLNHWNNHFLQTDTAMHKVHTAAIHLDADTFSRCKSIKFCFAAQELHRQQEVGLCTFLHDCITSAIFHIHTVKAGIVGLIILGQRTVCIKESMVSRNQNIRATKFIYNNTHKVFQFWNCLITSRKNSSIRNMAGFINGIMINIHNVHTFHQSTSLCSLHGNDIIVFQSNACRIFCFQNLIPISACRRLTICQNRQNIVANFYFQFFMWQ